MPAERDIVKLHAAFSKLVAVAMNVKKRNQPEYMAYLTDQINAALAALGSDDEVKWPGTWANEFQLISGGKAEEEP